MRTARAVRARELSRVELVDAALRRLADVDAALNAFTVVLGEEVRARARAAEHAVREGEPLRTLHGVPVSVKDALWLAGAPATYGSEALRAPDFVPDRSRSVDRLLAAGAIAVGKTTNPELCLRGVTRSPLHGVTRNPNCHDRTPGSSSGAAGAEVTAGVTRLALGIDGGGSIRIPAFCGVAGLKPRFGRDGGGPGSRGWPSLSLTGPLARTVRALGGALGVRSGRARGAAPAPPQRAVSEDLGFAPLEPAVRAAFRRAVAGLEEEGWELTDAHPATEDGNPLCMRIATVEAYASHRHLLEEHPAALSAESAEIIGASRGGSASEYLDVLEERARYTAAWDAFLDEHELLVCPTMQLTAFELGRLIPADIGGAPVDPTYDDWCALCVPANLTGQPAVSVPCGVDDDGLPRPPVHRAPRRGRAGSGGRRGLEASDTGGPEVMTESVPASEHAERIRRVQEEAGRRGLDGVLAWSKSGGTIDAFSDVFYLTNWYTPFPRIEDQPPVWAARAYAAVYVPTDGAPTLIVDVPDYRRDLVAVDDVRPGINLPATVAAVISEHGAAHGRIGLAAAETMLLGSWRQLQEALPAAEWVPADDILMSLRAIKSDAEIALLRRATRVGSELVSEMMRTARQPGTTEAEAIAAAWKVAIEAGAIPWDSAAASGPNSDYYAWKGMPSWSQRRLEPGDIFHADNYGALDGYLYDLSRSCVCGVKATADQREVLDGAVGCVEAIIAEIRPGVTAGRLYEVGSAYLTDRGLAGEARDGEVSVALVSSFPAHGHGLGTAFESPWLREGNDAPIEERMVLAIETMAGRAGVGAAKFEQDVLVTAVGAELLTEAPKVWWS